jgi:2-oxo-4-hydroxy-4-carboxy-5-ureidoimidazoline decarboxylase
VSVTISELDAMPSATAAELLRACCGAERWVQRMVARRPFGSAAALRGAADEIWGTMAAADWMEAFSHHPRIGETAGVVPQDARGAAWSAGEQASAMQSDEEVRAELARVNREYEARFGHTYIVCATGKSAREMLDIARARLDNDAGEELAIAAEEQRRIMQIRLGKLLGEPA